MNYYEHHIGDYDKNTSHLTACEDGIYSRLIRRYYDKERSLPAEVNEVKRLARARSRDERAAVDAVLAEFFHLEADGWHHKVCDEVIALFQAGEPEREAKKKNEDTRLARHRAERAELFAVINGAGQHMAWNTPMAELRAAADRFRKPGTATPETAFQPEPATQPATATATPATATQTPLPTPHSPLPSTSSLTEQEVGGIGAPENPAGLPPQPLLEQQSAEPPAIPACDHQAVLKLWQQLVPGNPQPAKWGPARQGHLRARWRELFVEGKAKTRDDALAWFAKYFRWIAQSRFLTGRTKGTDGRPPFEAKLDWVLEPENLAKVIEGDYHRED